MVKAKRRRAMQWRRLFASLFIALMTVSAIAGAAPIGSDATAGQSAESKIDGSLLDRTESEDTLDLL
ncbi:MAG: hypothetical protein ACFFD9_06365, partial [Candidatus Thorarchaeota archaeon]